MILTSWPKLILFLSFILTLTVLTIPDDSKLGIIYFNSYKYDEALYYFDRAKNKNISSVSVLKKMKDYFIIKGELDKAITSQARITIILPKNIKHLEELAQLYDWNNQPRLSLKAKEKAIKLANTSSKYDDLLKIQQGYIWLRAYDEANRIGEELYKSDIPSVLIQNLNYYLSIRDSLNVQKHIKRLQALNSQQPYTLNKYLAQSYELDGDYTNAIRSYISFLTKKNLDQINIKKGNFLAGQTKKFIVQNDTTINRIVYLYEQLDNDLAMAKIYGDIYDIDNTKFDTGLDAAQIYLKHKKFNKMKSILSKVYNVRSASRLYRAGHMFLKIKDYKNSIKYFKRVLQLYPFRVEYYKDLSYLYEVTNQPKKALEIQYKLLKYLKKDGSVYFINAGEILVTSNELNTSPDTEILNTQNKIIELLDKIGEKEKKLKELKKFTKSNPADFNLNKKLAFSYLEQNQKQKAHELLRKLYQMNAYDTDVNLYMANYYIDKNEHEIAKDVVLLIKSKNTIEIQNTLFRIYSKKSIKDAKKICQDLERYKDSNNYTYTELKSNCLELDGKTEKAINLVYEYTSNFPDHIDSKVKLVYLTLTNKDLELSNKIIKQLKNSTLPKDDLQKIETYRDQLIVEINLTNSWEHSIDFSYFETKNFNYWANSISIYKNYQNIGLGVNLFRAKTNKSIQELGHNNFSLKYALNDDLSIKGTIGSNYGNNTKPRSEISIAKSLFNNTYISASVKKNKQLYDTQTFATTKEALKDSQNLYLKTNLSLQHEIEGYIAKEDYKVSSSSAQTLNYHLQYNYYIYPKWSLGFYNSIFKTLSADPSLAVVLTDVSNIYALNLRNKVFFNNKKQSSTTDLYIGADNQRDIGFGKYLIFKNQFNYNITLRKQFYFNFTFSNESIEIESQRSTTTSMGYNYWF